MPLDIRELPLPDESEVIFPYKDRELCHEDDILAYLLVRGELLVFDHDTEDGRTVMLAINCSDLFYWGCADLECFTSKDLPSMFRYMKEDEESGISKWCCAKRKLRPQIPIELRWRERGKWTDELEALPKPTPS